MNAAKCFLETYEVSERFFDTWWLSLMIILKAET